MYRKRMQNKEEKHMATATFNKRIVLDTKAAQRLANASSVSCSFVGEKEKIIKNMDEMKEWLSHLKK